MSQCHSVPILTFSLSSFFPIKRTHSPSISDPTAPIWAAVIPLLRPFPTWPHSCTPVPIFPLTQLHIHQPTSIHSAVYLLLCFCLSVPVIVSACLTFAYHEENVCHSSDHFANSLNLALLIGSSSCSVTHRAVFTWECQVITMKYWLFTW